MVIQREAYLVGTKDESTMSVHRLRKDQSFIYDEPLLKSVLRNQAISAKRVKNRIVKPGCCHSIESALIASTLYKAPCFSQTLLTAKTVRCSNRISLCRHDYYGGACQKYYAAKQCTLEAGPHSSTLSLWLLTKSVDERASLARRLLRLLACVESLRILGTDFQTYCRTHFVNL